MAALDPSLPPESQGTLCTLVKMMTIPDDPLQLSSMSHQESCVLILLGHFPSSGIDGIVMNISLKSINICRD